MPKNAQTTTQLHSFHRLAKWCSKFSKPGINSMWTVNFQMFKLNLEKAEEPEIKFSTSVVSLKKQESSRKTSTSVYWLWQSLWLCGSQQTVENSERDGNTRPPYLPPERSVCRSRSKLEPKDWFQIGKGYVKAVYGHPAYLTYIQITCKMPGWMSTSWNQDCWEKYQ